MNMDLIKRGSVSYLLIFLDVLNTYWKSGSTPHEQKVAVISKISKQGAHYRGINLSNS
jgi:hypothetical protein